MADFSIAYQGDVVTRAQALEQGVKHYFTGVPCKRGHLSQRLVCNCGCIKCGEGKGKKWHAANRGKSREQNRAWKARNPERNIAIRAAWYAANREHAIEYAELYRKENLEKTRQRRSDYAKTNKEKLSAQWASYRVQNKDKRAAYTKVWHLKNPDARRVYQARRRVRAKESGENHTQADVADLFKMQNGKCAICLIRINQKSKRIDHIMPLALGGTNGKRNIQLLCEPCNGSKHSKHPIRFAQERGLLL